jgi:SUKH superfamily protein
MGRVEGAEAMLGVRFPATYRAFLLELGAGGIDGDEIYGVIADNSEASGIPDVVWATMSYRRDLGLEHDGIAIGYDGGEGFMVLDLGRRAPDDTAPVVRWSPELILEASEVIASDFADYLEEILTREI